ncbi:MAG: hypothetical protein K8L97_02290 [Anaerolineae bacterium]|nr:hypothetical protein [Anaerolineae bacterium]
MNPGTTTQNSLSTGQKIATALIWLGALAIIGLLISQLPSGDDNPIAIILTLALILGAFFLTFRIATRAAGKSTIRITAPEGLRGEFSVRRFWPRVGAYLVGMLTLVCIMGILGEPPESNVIWGWALTALIPLVIYGLLLLRLRGQITAFRVDADGSVWIKRGNNDWLTLRITDYGRIIGHTVSGRYGVHVPSRIDFLDPLNFESPVKIPLSLIKSREYNTITYGTVVDEFFRQQCQRADYRIQKRGEGWLATPTRHL